VQPTTISETANRSISLFGVALVIISALLTSTANLLFRFSMNDTGRLSLPLTFARLFHSPPFYIAWALYFLAAGVWFRVLKTEPLSSSYPILMGLTFVIVSMGAVKLFSEDMSLIKVAGIAIILFGMVLVSRA
jgi:multidrug transporter EmrE-like cation transporter